MKREIILYTKLYRDACFLVNTLYRPSIDKSPIFCTETNWYGNDDALVFEQHDCIYYIYYNHT